MNYLQIEKASVANGIGVRTVLWVSGCSLHCKGCQNPETWDFNAGKPFDDKAKQELFSYLSLPYIRGLTISGGHPLEEKNVRAIVKLISDVIDIFPQKDIWLYTGLKLSKDIFLSPFAGERIDVYRHAALIYSNVVVDGEYREELRDTTLPFRGSSNQRLIDVKKTLNAGEIVLYGE